MLITRTLTETERQLLVHTMNAAAQRLTSRAKKLQPGSVRTKLLEKSTALNNVAKKFTVEA